MPEAQVLCCSLPDDRLTHPDDRLHLPDDRLTLPDDRLTLPDDWLHLPDDWLLLPDDQCRLVQMVFQKPHPVILLAIHQTPWLRTLREQQSAHPGYLKIELLPGMHFFHQRLFPPALSK
jgi:hypothetical protein